MRRAWLVIAASSTRKKKQSASANNLTTRSARVVSSFNEGWKPRHEKAADTIRSYVIRRDPQCGVGCTAVVFLSENASWLDYPWCLLPYIAKMCGGSLFSSRARGESWILLRHFARVCVNVLCVSVLRVGGAQPSCIFECALVSVTLLAHRMFLTSLIARARYVWHRA